MKKIIAALSLFLLAFSAFTQEQKSDGKESEKEITFSIDENKTEIEIPRILVHRNSFWNMGYEFSDGGEISNSDLNKLLKSEADRIFVRKAKIWNGIAYLSVAGALASYGVNVYANIKEFDDMSSVSFTTLAACLVTGLISRITSDYYQNLAVDSYNLKILGLNQEK